MSQAQHKSNSKLTPIAKVVPIMIGLAIGFGFGQRTYEVIGETTGWGFYSPATFCVGTVILASIGALTGYVAGVAIAFYGIKVKS